MRNLCHGFLLPMGGKLKMKNSYLGMYNKRSATTKPTVNQRLEAGKKGVTKNKNPKITGA